MAGDWIKMRSDLADDPAVIGIAARLGIDEFAVVGRLQYLWAWIDSQSRDGHAVGVTCAWLDRKVQRDGFARAMVDVGWLSVTAEGIEIPNFERHNGETAKTRALGTKRKKKQRAGVTVVPPIVPDASRNERDKSETREEKRRVFTEANASAADAAPDLTKAELWEAGKSLLLEAGVPKGQCGTFVGKLVQDYGDGIVIDAVRAAVVAMPADPREYLKATCMRLKGERGADHGKSKTVPSGDAERTKRALDARDLTPEEQERADVAAAAVLARHGRIRSAA